MKKFFLLLLLLLLLLLTACRTGPEPTPPVGSAAPPPPPVEPVTIAEPSKKPAEKKKPSKFHWIGPALTPDGPPQTRIPAATEWIYLRFRYSGPEVTLVAKAQGLRESLLLDPSQSFVELELPPEWKEGRRALILLLEGEEVARAELEIVPRFRGNLPLKLPQVKKQTQKGRQEVERLRDSARAYPSAAAWRQVADRAAELDLPDLAAEAYQKEAAVYRGLGDPNAALVEERKAARFRTDHQLYLHTESGAGGSTGARLEPESGCYLGAFIDRDDALKSLQWRNQRHGSVDDFNRLVGKPHASFFTYRSYGQPFPQQWADYLKERGAIPHLAWEPKDLNQVTDDDYLRGWVEAARKYDHPLFIRFASEMNGEWTPYHGDPERYKKAFRTVYKAFRTAPKVALIWCPNTVPQSSIEQYYPGDEHTDWVGVNFYSVRYLDDDPSRPGDTLHPVDLLDFVYKTYGSRKPIAIGEYAATHENRIDADPVPGFAVTKMGQLYGSLATRYPRVKLVSWYDCNNLKHARPGRRLNNYLVTAPEPVLESYRALTSPDHFLKAGQSRSRRRAVPFSGQVLSRDESMELWLRTYLERPRVYFVLDGKVVFADDRPGRWRLDLDDVEPGKHQLKILVFGDKDEQILRLVKDFKLKA